ncbi:M16 family metallopeptidase [Insolitispirillum peregrinum]|uniref:Predicted Zn-dependent peptidase n=1 Tax=Insolitispirillum peregrinum TaxID=80876 RepID=A0A1N7JAN7_9PROT|nr:pitrilysin family protein [Insolitispirillum peregrinum]SIS46388.1 Predicted Zn-dependent peptidase [Insolitispirillum peregrinum]
MSVAETRLDNGLIVLTDTMRTVETVSLGAWVDVGTRHETPEVNGISHLLEHMAFKGTERRSAQKIAEEIENVGGHLNAYTSREHTAYYAKVLKNDAALAVDIIADILQHSAFDPEELQREQSVVIQEIHQADDTPDDIIFDYFQNTAYPDQALGQPVLGRPDIVRSISSDVLKDYMQSRYTTGSMVLTAAGNIDHDDFVRQVERQFTALRTAPAQKPTAAAYKGGDFRQDRDLEQVHLVLGFDGIAYEDPLFYSAAVLSTLLGGGMSSRLFQEVREKRGLVYSIYSYASAYTDGGLFTIYAGTGEDDVAEMIPVMCDEIRKVTDGLTEDELARARAQLKAGILMGMESTSNRCEQAARHIMSYQRSITAEELVESIEGVTADGVVSAAQRIFASAPTLTTLGAISKVETYDAVCRRLNG